MTMPSAVHAPFRHKLGADGVNYLNIALMLLSAGLALAFPFGLFLFSYAVLGPLHYLTEISWLHDRKYFTKGRNDHLILGLVGLAFTVQSFGFLPTATDSVMPSVLFLTLVTAGAFAFTSDPRTRIGVACCAAIFIPAISGSNLLLTVFGILLPTIVHVFLFTGMFILAGTLRSRSVSGGLSFAVFAAVSLGLLLWHPAWSSGTEPGGYVRSSYGDVTPTGSANGFLAVNYVLLQMLTPDAFPTATGAVAGVSRFLYEHPMARSVMAFIAFAYTYHYLNWFSKTSVIRWHKVPVRRLGIILAIWVASLVLYALDYNLGARWLYFLSFLHVVLEFPLNHVTFMGIVRALRPPAPAS